MNDPEGKRPRRASLRLRIMAVAVLVVTLLLVVTGYSIVFFVERTLHAQVDDALAYDADFIERTLPTMANLPPGSSHPVLIVQLYGSEGQLVGGNESAEDLSAIIAATEVVATTGASYTTEEVAGLGTMRVYLTPIGESQRFHLAVARPIDDIDAAMATLVQFVLLMAPLLALVLCLVIWVVVDRALRPVNDIRRTVAAIGPTDLERRVPVSGSGDEIDELAGTMNEMLERLERSSLHQRHFVADASHELRSPLAGLRVLLETEPNDPESVSATRGEALESVWRLQGLVSDLLTLARADASAPEPPHEAVDLDEIVLRHGIQLRRVGRVEVDMTGVSGAQVTGRAGDLDRVVDNLVSNAGRYAASTVQLCLSESDDGVELLVADDGPGVAPKDRERIFERFTRVDDARSREQGGAGLGLAIVAEIVDRHGGSVVVDDDPTLGGARFVVRLPSTLH